MEKMQQPDGEGLPGIVLYGSNSRFAKPIQGGIEKATMKAWRQCSPQDLSAMTAMNHGTKHDAGWLSLLVPDDGSRACLALFCGGIDQLLERQCVQPLCVS